MKKAEATRQRLYDTATRLFVEQGYEATTMRDIAREAGMGTGSAYYHFPSKESFVAAFYHQLHTDNVPDIDAIVAETDELAERLVRYSTWKLDNLAPARPLLRAVAGAVLRPDGPLSPFGEEAAWIREQDMGNYRRLLDGCAVPAETERVVQLIWMAWMAIVFAYVFLDHADPTRRARRMVQVGFGAVASSVQLAATPMGAPLWQMVQALFDSWEEE